MDTEDDFITSEFFHLLFFKQKNIVIYPYVDIKHFRSLDLFAVGYDTIDIDSTVIHNLSDVIEYESSSSYSQQPTLYFILNPSFEEVEKLIESPSIRCVVNSKENLSSLANGDEFVFYNKKSKSFLNYSFNAQDLSFENHLIQISTTKQVLLDEILKIKSASSKIFAELNDKGNLDALPDLLSDYDSKYWDKILDFTHLYCGIEIPEFKKPKRISKKKNSPPEKDFSSEYEIILKSNSAIGKSFVQLLHNYRFEKVNPANLEVDQLFYPQKLYNYLRNRHWKHGIPKEFVSDWVRTVSKDENPEDEALVEFQVVLNKLSLPFSLSELTTNLQTLPSAKLTKEETVAKDYPKKVTKKKIARINDNSIPSIDNFQEFKQWLLKKMSQLERLGENKLRGDYD